MSKRVQCFFCFASYSGSIFHRISWAQHWISVQLAPPWQHPNLVFPPTMKGKDVCRCRPMIRPKSGISTTLNASSSYISFFLADNLLKTKSFTIFKSYGGEDITLCRLPRRCAAYLGVVVSPRWRQHASPIWSVTMGRKISQQ